MLAPDHFLIRYRRTIAQAALLVYVLNPLLVTAQVIINAGTANDGRRTFVDQTQSGVTKVNITTPNGAGVSHNSYQQFDVPKTGVVLNNGANNSNTRIAGWVEGNPNLRPGQEAKLILNEVVGGKPSQLQGYLEVAGTKADVIVANENGITCNGCGFINTGRASLVSGKPLVGSVLEVMRDGGEIPRHAEVDEQRAGGCDEPVVAVEPVGQAVDLERDARLQRDLEHTLQVERVNLQVVAQVFQADTALAAVAGQDQALQRLQRQLKRPARGVRVSAKTGQRAPLPHKKSTVKGRSRTRESLVRQTDEPPQSLTTSATHNFG